MIGSALYAVFNIRVPVIDDQRTMRLIIRQLLVQLEIDDIIESGNGISAIAILARTECTPPPDVIVCDLRMDKIDGMEFLNRICRGRVNIDLHTPVPILTGEPDRLVLSVTEQVGAASVLKRPISATDLGYEIGQAIDLKI